MVWLLAISMATTASVAGHPGCGRRGAGAPLAGAGIGRPAGGIARKVLMSCRGVPGTAVLPVMLHVDRAGETCTSMVVARSDGSRVSSRFDPSVDTRAVRRAAEWSGRERGGNPPGAIRDERGRNPHPPFPAPLVAGRWHWRPGLRPHPAAGPRSTPAGTDLAASTPAVRCTGSTPRRHRHLHQRHSQTEQRPPASPVTRRSGPELPFQPIGAALAAYAPRSVGHREPSSGGRRS